LREIRDVRRLGGGGDVAGIQRQHHSHQILAGGDECPKHFVDALSDSADNTEERLRDDHLQRLSHREVALPTFNDRVECRLTDGGERSDECRFDGRAAARCASPQSRWRRPAGHQRPATGARVCA
jgi:hypothetical protein